VPRFHYPLQPALERAVTREREALAVVARAQNALEAERRALAAVDRQLFDVLHGAYSLAKGGRRAVAPWLDVAAHAAALAKLRTARSLSVGAAHGDAAESRAAHDVARRRQRALSRLREQHYEVFLLAMRASGCGRAR